MATDIVTELDKGAKNTSELLAFIKKELDADAERQAKLQAADAGELPHESQTGVTLDLGHKNLRALPLEVIALIKDKVERLALSHNPQIAVPTQIAQCERLRYLNIRWNQLVHFPEAVLQLSQLEILDVSKNRITAIPEDIKKLTSLKFLAVSRNRITRLPFALGEMSSLGKLKFDENPIEYPPPDALKLSSDASTSAFEAEREKDICQKVKRYLRAAAVKEKLKAVSEEDLSEGNVETPRPPKRVFTSGRFPIRPSISGLDSIGDVKNDSPSDIPPPAVPERSHTRGDSANAPVPKRPGIAPLLTGGNDFTRSQSEMVPSSASLRQRRQGFVPSRRPTGGLGSVNEAASGPDTGSTIRPSHSRAASSISIVNGATGPDASDTPGVFSPVSRRFDNFRILHMLPGYRTLKKQGNSVIKASKRLIIAMCQLESPISAIAVSVKDDGILCRSTLEHQLLTAQAQMKELNHLLNRLETGAEDDVKAQHKITKAIIRTAVQALKSFVAVTTTLKRKRDEIVARADGIYLRSLMFEIYGATVEARNICTVLGYEVKETTAHGATAPSASRPWSSKSITPTQSKPPTSRRILKSPTLPSMGNDIASGMQPPPMMPLSTDSSRTSTMTSQSSTLVPTNPLGSRSNTMRGMMNDGDVEEQFGQIFQKLQSTCNLASQALPHCRSEFLARKELAQSSRQRINAHHWSMVLTKCDEVIAHNKALRKRLEVVKVNDPGLRYHRDFWQLCDAFVYLKKSWTEFATEVKELSNQRVDISAVKQIMRNVQRQVKDVSKTIFNSPLYHHAPASSKGSDSTLTLGLASPLPSPFHSRYPSHSSPAASVPATPFSAALGPAVQATVATPNSTTIPRDYFPEPQTARPVRDHNRHDTPLQPQYPRKL